MNLVRAVAFAAAAPLLVGGYLASQSAFLASRRPESYDATIKFSQALDAAPVKALALAVLLVCALSASLPQREDTE